MIVLDTPSGASNAVIGTYDFKAAAVRAWCFSAPPGLPSTSTTPALTAIRQVYHAREPVAGTLEEWTGRFDAGYNFQDGMKVAAGMRYVGLPAESESYSSRGLATRAELTPFGVSGDPNFLGSIQGDLLQAFYNYFLYPDFFIPRVLATEPPLGTDEPRQP